MRLLLPIASAVEWFILSLFIAVVTTYSCSKYTHKLDDSFEERATSIILDILNTLLISKYHRKTEILKYICWSFLTRFLPIVYSAFIYLSGNISIMSASQYSKGKCFLITEFKSVKIGINSIISGNVLKSAFLLGLCVCVYVWMDGCSF